MTLDNVLAPIEGYPFIAKIAIASDWRIFRHALFHSPELADLAARLADPSLHQPVAQRVLDLSQRETDPRYENPWDIPLATYLYALHVVGSPLARFAAQEATAARNCPWLNKVIGLVFNACPSASQLEFTRLLTPPRPSVTFAAAMADNAYDRDFAPTIVPPTPIRYTLVERIPSRNAGSPATGPMISTPSPSSATTHARGTARPEMAA